MAQHHLSTVHVEFQTIFVFFGSFEKGSQFQNFIFYYILKDYRNTFADFGFIFWFVSFFMTSTFLINSFLKRSKRLYICCLIDTPFYFSKMQINKYSLLFVKGRKTRKFSKIKFEEISNTGTSTSIAKKNPNLRAKQPYSFLKTLIVVL